jgi:hypothetical protein
MEEHYAVVYHTDYDWFSFLRQNLKETERDLEVNFWTGRDRDLKLNKGMYFFFKLKNQTIGGYGLFVEIKKESIKSAWNEYGIHNGVASFEEFLAKTSKILNARSLKHVVPNSTVNISCYILKSLHFFSEPISLNEVGIKHFQVARYIDEPTTTDILRLASSST